MLKFGTKTGITKQKDACHSLLQDPKYATSNLNQ